MTKWYDFLPDGKGSWNEVLLLAFNIEADCIKDAIEAIIEFYPDGATKLNLASDIDKPDVHWQCAEFNNGEARIAFNYLLVPITTHDEYTMAILSYPTPTYETGLALCWYLTTITEGIERMWSLINDNL